MSPIFSLLYAGGRLDCCLPGCRRWLLLTKTALSLYTPEDVDGTEFRILPRIMFLPSHIETNWDIERVYASTFLSVAKGNVRREEDICPDNNTNHRNSSKTSSKRTDYLKVILSMPVTKDSPDEKELRHFRDSKNLSWNRLLDVFLIMYWSCISPTLLGTKVRITGASFTDISLEQDIY